MVIEKALDNILNMPSKGKIIRLFVSKRRDFVATGREVARLTEMSPPAAHTALKELYDQQVLNRDIIGKQHLYRLNSENRNVKNILIPAFRKELSVKNDIGEYLIEKIKINKLENRILSLMIYGSLQKGTAVETSDVDIAVIIKNNADPDKIENIFIEKISSEFHLYFGAHLDPYIKRKNEFIALLNKNLPPVSTLMKSYTVISGRDPMDIR